MTTAYRIVPLTVMEILRLQVAQFQLPENVMPALPDQIQVAVGEVLHGLNMWFHANWIGTHVTGIGHTILLSAPLEINASAEKQAYVQAAVIAAAMEEEHINIAATLTEILRAVSVPEHRIGFTLRRENVQADIILTRIESEVHLAPLIPVWIAPVSAVQERP